MLSKKQEIQREKLRLEVEARETQLVKIRQQIRFIDAAEKLKQKQWMLGKCFALKRSDDKRAGQSGYCRVDSFWPTGEPKGIFILPTGKNGWQIEINTYSAIFENYIVNGRRIKHTQFNKYLTAAKKALILKK